MPSDAEVNMHIELIRRRIINDATEGDLLVNGAAFCHTLEDVVRPDPNPATPQNEGKVWGRTAIPEGTFRVILDRSPRFQRVLPRLLGVPGFDGILIHKGNGPENTEGCILVGDKLRDGRIVGGTSTPAFERLMDLLRGAKEQGEQITITIRNAFAGVAHA